MLSALTITEAHEQLKKKVISSEELVLSCIERIEGVDSALNAIIFRNFERALEKAKKTDAEGIFDHPLKGIPYITKDAYCERGVPSRGGSNMLQNKDYIAPYDATTPKRLNGKGAFSLGKANCDEFTMGGSGETSAFGPTRNPWNTKCVAGGSSSGSTAAVAADECLFGLGTDTGGSIRCPAGYCNAVGMRVTYGRTSRYGAMRMAGSLDTTGAITKSVEDMAIVLEAIAGIDPFDVTTVDIPVPGYRAALKKKMKGITIGMPKEYFIEGLNPEVEHAVREAASEFEKLGAKITEISLPHTKYAVPTYYIIVPSDVSSNMARYDGIRFGHTTANQSDLREYYEQVRSEGFGAEVKRRIMIGTYVTSAGYYDAYYRQAQKVRTLLRRDFDEAFKHVDLILSPVNPSPAFEVGVHDDDPVAMYLEDVFLVSAVLAGIPAITVPCGFSSKSLPIGLQLMGPQWSEELLLQAGFAYEQQTEWHNRKPKL